MRLTSPFQQVEAIYNEGAPEFVVDQGLLYPAATSYGYYCTGAYKDLSSPFRFLIIFYFILFMLNELVRI